MLLVAPIFQISQTSYSWRKTISIIYMGTPLQKKNFAIGVGVARKCWARTSIRRLFRLPALRTKLTQQSPPPLATLPRASNAQRGRPELTSAAHARTPGKPRRLLEASAGRDEEGGPKCQTTEVVTSDLGSSRPCSPNSSGDAPGVCLRS